MRSHITGDPEAGVFAEQLLRIGDGKVAQNNRGLIHFPRNFGILVANVEELIDKVFPNLTQNIDSPNYIHERAILAPTNDSVEQLNLQIQEKLSNRPTRTYLSIDQTVEPDQAVNYPVEFLNSLAIPGLPPHKLTLKIGSPIMLLRNLDPPRLCNGTRLSVKKLHINSIEATILVGSFAGETVFIPRIPLIPADLVFEFKRLQFPVRLAYAMTINKSQGQSLRFVGLELSSPCFTHGQLYVACSRVGSSSNMFILAPNGETKNIVYEQVLN